MSHFSFFSFFFLSRYLFILYHTCKYPVCLPPPSLSLYLSFGVCVCVFMYIYRRTYAQWLSHSPDQPPAGSCTEDGAEADGDAGGVGSRASGVVRALPRLLRHVPGPGLPQDSKLGCALPSGAHVLCPVLPSRFRFWQQDEQNQKWAFLNGPGMSKNATIMFLLFSSFSLLLSLFHCPSPFFPSFFLSLIHNSPLSSSLFFRVLSFIALMRAIMQNRFLFADIAEDIMRNEGHLIYVPEWHYNEPPQAKLRWGPLLSRPRPHTNAHESEPERR